MEKLCERNDKTSVAQFSVDCVEFSKKIETFRQNIGEISFPPENRKYSKIHSKILNRLQNFDVFSNPTFGEFTRLKVNEFESITRWILTECFKLMKSH